MQAVIIAAGESSRFWPLNREHKSQIRLLGRPIIYWTIKGLAERGIKDIIVVCSKDSTMPAMLKAENNLGIKLSFAIQEERQGTGNALWQAKDFITEPFFVVWPSKVTSGDLVQKILEKQKQESAEIVLVGTKTSTPWDYGVARMEGENVKEIVENPKPGEEPSNIKIIGFYFLQPDFFSYYEKLPRHHEADLIDALNLYLKEKRASLVSMEKDMPALKYPWELFGILDLLLHLQSGKQMIASSAKIGEGTVIEGSVYIGEDCVIGPYNVLRGPLNLERGVKTRAFCEIKHSVAQEGTHFHSGYIGDSIIGKDCRFGAGVITANRRLDRGTINAAVKEKKVDTGLTSLGAVIGNEAQFGIHSGTMPGVFIGSQCVIGPGTLVFKNMQDRARLFTKFQNESLNG
ncbi:MAG: sugar phosphate nucleotidyltransferase [bacterium]|nr:sugar phosphate nucleotidyltransferase [bacterium]